MLKIENGKRYVTRGGDIVGPMNVPPKWPYWIAAIVADCGDSSWKDGGFKEDGGNPHQFDLISEYVEAPAIDLTAITTPFGLLDDATKSALKAHSGPYDVWSGGAWRKIRREGCSFTYDYTYRVAPAPACTPDVVPWDAVDDRFNWYARDKDGTPWFYISDPKPTRQSDWVGCSFEHGGAFKITIGTAPWDKSLQRRPGK